MRWSRLAGVCSLVLASQAVVACDDDEDRKSGSAGTGASDSESGKSAGGSAGKDQGGSDQGGSNTVAGTGFGESGSGGSAGTAGAGGMAGTGGAPTCATFCNDNNPCTDDACEAGDVCVHRDNTATCDDANACTSTDTCAAGICKGTSNTDACDDANACTSGDACTNGACTGTNNTDACDDGNVCTSNDACAAGTCTGTNNTLACDDLTSCTTGDACWRGECKGNPNLAHCPACDVAGNLIQNCDFTDGENHWPEGFFGGAGTQVVTSERLVVDITAGGNNDYEVQPRQEPLALKLGMKYRLRMVAGASVNRSFVISLTQAVDPYDNFSPGDTNFGYRLNVTQQMEPFEFDFYNTRRDEANVKLEIKLGGQAGNPSVVYIDDVYLVELPCDGNDDCNDGKECTTDVCNTVAGTCSWTNSTAACTTDNNECTNDVCAAGVCTHPALPNNDPCTADAFECTADVCTAGVCTHPALPNDDPCTADVDACTADVCKAGQCTHDFDATACPCTADIDCNDDEVCTDEDCDTVTGICSNPFNTAACDDGDVCTSNEVCAAGECGGGTDNTAPCDDGNICTTESACAAGECAPVTNICHDCKVGGNLLLNCDMSETVPPVPPATATTAANWLEGFFGGTGAQSVDNGMLRIDVATSGTEVWMIQPRQAGLVLTQNTTYVVRFNAMASIDRGIVVSLTQDGGGFASYSTQRPFALTTELQEFTFEFTMAAAPPAELVKLEFLLGGAANNPTVPNTVYLDNLFIAPKP